MTTVHDIADCLVCYAQEIAQLIQEALQSRKDIRMQEVLQWIEANYSKDISLDDIAEHMGLSSTYASKLIKTHTGSDVVAYINGVRLEHAKELLRNTKMSSNEISAYVGFHYPQSFIRSFKKYAGMTPGDYRMLNTASRRENIAETPLPGASPASE